MRLWIFILLMAGVRLTYGQKTFDVKIILNNNIDVKKIMITVDNGKTEYPPALETDSSGIRISDEFFGEYAEVLVKYPQKDNPNFSQLNTFFVGEEPAIIHFLLSKSRDPVLNHYKLQSATTFQEEKLQMHRYDSDAKTKVNEFSQKYGSKTFTDTTLFKQFLKLDNEIYDKDLEYILNNKDSYYAFSFFRRNFVFTRRLPADSILTILDSFPDKFKNSTEGETIRNLVRGWKIVRLHGNAPDFDSKDFNGRSVSLRDYTRKGYVLLNFWATWCGSCLEEMPEIREMFNQYSNGRLTIISIAYPSNHSDYEKDMRNYQMDWINIYNDVDLINSYGGDKPIPRLYLIDKNGMIIYAREIDSPDVELSRLKEVLTAALDNDRNTSR